MDVNPIEDESPADKDWVELDDVGRLWMRLKAAPTELFVFHRSRWERVVMTWSTTSPSCSGTCKQLLPITNSGSLTFYIANWHRCFYLDSPENAQKVGMTVKASSATQATIASEYAPALHTLPLSLKLVDAL